MTGWLVIGVLGVVAVLGLALMAPEWVYHWRHAAHVIEVTETEPVPALEYGSMILAEEQAHRGTVLLPAPVEPGDWTDELLGMLHEAGPRPRGMVEPGDLEPGAGPFLSTGYNSHLPSGHSEAAKVDSPAPDDMESSALPGQEGPEGIPGSADGPRNVDAAGAGVESEPCGVTAPPAPEPIVMPRLGSYIRNQIEPEQTRLLRTTGEIMRADLLADVCADIARRDAEVAVWLVNFQRRWAAA